MLKNYLESLKDDNKLRNAVIDYYIDRYGNDESIEDLYRSMEDLQQHGCQSGMISHLIYYSDTVEFYENFKEEINQMLSELIEGTGLSLQELFGDKYDKEDPLNINDYNKNLFAWYGFEETSSKLYEEMQEKRYNINDYEIEESMDDI